MSGSDLRNKTDRTSDFEASTHFADPLFKRGQRFTTVLVQINWSIRRLLFIWVLFPKTWRWKMETLFTWCHSLR